MTEERSPTLRANRLRAALRCVTCHGQLDSGDRGLGCPNCQVVYRVMDGVPVLMTEHKRAAFETNLASANGQRMAAEYARTSSAPKVPRGRSWLRWLVPPSVMYRYHPDLTKGPTAILFEAVEGVAPLTLSVGGGPHRVSDVEITLNIGLFPNVDIVADAHDIPLADNTVDAVFSLAVLEHVANPQRVVDEMVRVLKPGGVLYSEVPFIFFFHGYPTDYTRFTHEGMKNLFSGLASPRIGMSHGPVSAVLQSTNMLLEMFLPVRPRVIRKGFNGVFRWLFFPLKYLDLALRDHPDAHVLAAGFYVLGRKPLKA